MIDIYSGFVYGDGSVAKHQFVRDGIHLSPRGAFALVLAINKRLRIIKQQSSPISDKRTTVTDRTRSMNKNLTRRWQHSSKRSNGYDFSSKMRYGGTGSRKCFDQCFICGRINHKSKDCWYLN
jgi:hypothetical protein